MPKRPAPVEESGSESDGEWNAEDDLADSESESDEELVSEGEDDEEEAVESSSEEEEENDEDEELLLSESSEEDDNEDDLSDGSSEELSDSDSDDEPVKPPTVSETRDTNTRYSLRPKAKVSQVKRYQDEDFEKLMYEDDEVEIRRESKLWTEKVTDPTGRTRKITSETITRSEKKTNGRVRK